MVMIVTVLVLVIVVIAVLVMVMVMAVVVMMVVVVVAIMFLAAFDIFQLQVNHVLLTTTAIAVTDYLIAVQILVTEPVTAKRLGCQIVPRLDRFYGAVLASVCR